MGPTRPSGLPTTASGDSPRAVGTSVTVGSPGRALSSIRVGMAPPGRRPKPAPSGRYDVTVTSTVTAAASPRANVVGSSAATARALRPREVRGAGIVAAPVLTSRGEGKGKGKGGSAKSVREPAALSPPGGPSAAIAPSREASNTPVGRRLVDAPRRRLIRPPRHRRPPLPAGVSLDGTRRRCARARRRARMRGPKKKGAEGGGKGGCQILRPNRAREGGRHAQASS